MPRPRIEIQIDRDENGRLHAHVFQPTGGAEYAKGADMLRRQVYRDVTAARLECERQMRETYKLIDPPKIEFLLPQEGPL